MSGRLARSYAGADPRRRAIGWALVILIHVAALWALVSGTARKGLEILKKPMEAAVIQEVIIPPPPPPPPKQIKPPEPQAPRTEAPPPPFVPPPEVAPPVTAAPAIVATPTPPPAPPVIAPPPPPAPPAPPAPAPAPPPPRPTQIGVICPTQVAPVMPRRAIQAGIEGLVRAQAVIRDGAIKEVVILSGPRELHGAVRDAMLQYKCISDAAEIRAVQEFNFKLD